MCSGRAAVGVCPTGIMPGEQRGGTTPARAPGGHQTLQEPRCPAPRAGCSRYPQQVPTPARSLCPSTYQQPLAALIGHPWRLERGAGCLPRGSSAARSPSRWLRHQHRHTSIYRQSKLGRGERDTKRDVTGGVGTSPPQASPSLQELGGCARQVAPPYLPARGYGSGVGGGRWARGQVGWRQDLFLLAPTPSGVSEPPGTPHERRLPGVSQEAVKDLPGVDRRPCGQLATGLPVGGRGGLRAGAGAPPSSPPARAGAEVAAAHGSTGTGR